MTEERDEELRNALVACKKKKKDNYNSLICLKKRVAAELG